MSSEKARRTELSTFGEFGLIDHLTSTLKYKQDFFEEVYGLGFEIKQKKKKQ